MELVNISHYWSITTMGTKKAALENLKKVDKKTRKPRGKNKENKEKDIAFAEMIEHYQKGASKYFEKLTEADIRFALTQKNWKARKEVLDRLMGKAKDRLEIGGEGGGPLELDVRILTAMKKVYGNKDKK